MFNWLIRKNETIPSEETAPASEQAIPQSLGFAAPQTKIGLHGDDVIEKQIEDALNDGSFTPRHKSAIKQNMIGLVQRGLPTEALFSVLDAFNTNTAQNIDLEQIGTGKIPAHDKPKKETVLTSGQSADAPLNFLPAPFYDFLAWIEDTEQYRQLYANSSNQESSDICCFCGGSPDAAASINLLNGWRVHEKCYNLLTGNLKGLKSVLEAKIFFDASPNVMSAFRLINTFWPGTPPDWPVRRRTVVARADGRCEDCGKADDDVRDSLEIRLIKPIEKGGSHALENMICLCAYCRPQYVSDETLGSEDPLYGRKTYTQYKTDLLNRAMESQKDVRFTYHDEKGIVSVRTLTPKAWEKRRDTVCVAGFCCLTNDNESFKLNAMTELEFL